MCLAITNNSNFQTDNPEIAGKHIEVLKETTQRTQLQISFELQIITSYYELELSIKCI